MSGSPNPSHPSLLPRAILEAPVTEPRFLEQLQELDAKAAAVREQEARGTAACADVRGVLDRLRVKVVHGGGLSRLPEPASLRPSPWVSRSLSPKTLPCLYLAGHILTSLGSLRVLNMQEVFSAVSPPVFSIHYVPQCLPNSEKVAASHPVFGPPCPGGNKDPRVHPSEDLFLQEANDQLSDPPDGPTEVQVAT